MALPSNLLYSLKPESVPSKAMETKFLSSAGAGAVAPGSQIKIHIAGDRGSYLDTANSLLEFTVNNTSGDTAFSIDGHAASFIQRLEVYWNSTLVESISDYNVLFSSLYDASVSPSQRGMGDAILAGTGASDTLSRTGTTLAAESHRTFFIPILGLLGINAEKYLPMGFGEMRLELTLANNNDPIVAAGATTWTVSSCQYVGSIIKLDASAQMMIEQSLVDGQYQIHSSSYRAFSGAIAAQKKDQVSSLDMYVPGNFASLKTLYVAQRFTDKLNAVGSSSISDRTTNGLEDYYFRIGATSVPQTPVVGVVESYRELLKARHLLSTGQYEIALRKGNYELQSHASTVGSFLIGQDCESFSGKSGVIMSGMDTTNSPVYLIARYKPTQVDPPGLTVNVFAEFDQILYLDINAGGQAMVRF